MAGLAALLKPPAAAVVCLGALLKFNPDQPRAANGQWGEGSGGDYKQIFADNLGIARGDMPQIPNGAMKEKFLAEQAAAGVGHTQEVVMARSLKATQSTFNPESISYLHGANAGKFTGNPIVVSNDNRVIDGHHRWAGAHDANQPIEVIRVNMPAHELVAAARSFSERNTIPARKFWTVLQLSKFNPDQPRDASGRWGDGGLGDGGHDVKGQAETTRASTLITKDNLPTPGSFLSAKTIQQVKDVTAKYTEKLAADRVRLAPEQAAVAAEQLKGALAGAHADKPAYDAKLMAIGQSLGAGVMLADVKGGDRLLEKHVNENGNDASKMKDLVRGSIVVDKVSDVAAAIAAVRNNFEVDRMKNRFAAPGEEGYKAPDATGYRDVLMNVKLPSGIQGEIQIHVPEMLSSKMLGHALYDISRSLPAGHADAPVLDKMQARIYGGAFRANNRRGPKS